MSIELVQAYAHKDEIKILFSEYTGMLIEGDSRFKEYLAYYDGELAGCIGFRKIYGR